MTDAYKRAVSDLEKELIRATKLVYSSMALALNDLGWRTKRLDKLCKEMSQVLKFVSTVDKSIVQILDEEVGIELMCEESDKHYYELPYMSASVWEKYLKEHNNRVSNAYIISVKYAQKKWCRPQMYATVFIALHYLYGYGKNRINELYKRMYEIESEVNFNADTIEKKLKDTLGVILVHDSYDIYFKYIEEVGTDG